MHFCKWRPESLYRITDEISLTSSEVLRIAQQVIGIEESIRYDDRTFVTIDIASGMNNPIRSGIYFKIPKEKLVLPL